MQMANFTKDISNLSRISSPTHKQMKINQGMKKGDVISKDQIQARQDAITQQIASEQEQLKNCFNIDYIELD
jgi:Tfp pilus assembly protein PilO